jgi:hypothetical protein
VTATYRLLFVLVIVAHQHRRVVNRSRKRSPNLRLADRLDVGVCTLLMRPNRLVRSAMVLKPATLLRFHRALIRRKYRRLFSAPVSTKPGPKGPSQEVIAAVLDMKQRNPTWGCPRIAQQIALAFSTPMNKDVVRRILAVRYHLRILDVEQIKTVRAVSLWRLRPRSAVQLDVLPVSPCYGMQGYCLFQRASTWA